MAAVCDRHRRRRGGLAVAAQPGVVDVLPAQRCLRRLRACALALAVQGLTLIRQIRRYEHEQREYLAQGRPVKSATLPAEEYLTQEGVIRHVE